jgi:putative acetyltransferase
VFDELNIPKWNFLMQILWDLMFEEYNKPKSVYYVVENNGKVVGSGQLLENEAATICELQKMYFLPETRGLGIGSQVMAVAKRKRLDSKIVIWKRCLLCMMPKNIQKSGFEYINAPWVARDMSLASLDVEEIISYELCFNSYQ